eukprot:205225-Prymnesium_polylepis.2
MHFLSLTVYNVGLSRPLGAVLTPFGSVHIHTQFTPHPIPNAHDLAVSGPHPPGASQTHLEGWPPYMNAPSEERTAPRASRSRLGRGSP